MCQLVGCNLGKADLNSIILSSLLNLDSIMNSDGTGILATDGEDMHVWKSELAADDIPNLGLIIKRVVKTDEPVIGHVRAASKGIVVTKENAHPFLGSRFTLAHNGRLYDKGEKVSYSDNSDTSVASDSLKFLERLEKEAKENPKASILDLLNNSMKDFMGKFAFLLFDSKTKKHYAIRGYSADLHVAKIFRVTIGADQKEKKTQVGFVINTKKEMLVNALTLGIPIAQAISGKALFVGSIEELKKETVYEFGKTDLIEVGEMKEHTVSYTSLGAQSNWEGGTHRGNSWSAASTDYAPDTTVPVIAYAKRMSEFARRNNLGIGDIDLLVHMFVGVPLIGLKLDQLGWFCDQVIPKLSAPKKIRDKVRMVLRDGSTVYPSAYSHIEGFQYPWMLNSPSKIDAMIKFMNDMHTRKGK